MFVEVTGFLDTAIEVPAYLRSELQYDSDSDTDTTDCLKFALVRWLSPHPRAVLRDSESRPVCPPPFDVNHALWSFSRTPRQRIAFYRRNITRQLSLFPGNNDMERRAHARRLSHAWYDLVAVDTIEKYMNCTFVDNDSDTILQTITLPF